MLKNILIPDQDVLTSKRFRAAKIILIVGFTAIAAKMMSLL